MKCDCPAEGLQTPMDELVALLESPDETALSGALRDSVIAGLAGACAQIAKIQSLDSETDLGKLVKKVLLLAASNRYPEPDPKESEQTAPGLAGGWPVARIVATEGLLALAAGGGCTDPVILQTLEVLLRDTSAKVRYPIARYAIWMHKTDPAKMWKWLETLSKDKNISVREGCVHALDHLAKLDADRALELMDEVLVGAPAGEKEAEELTKYAVQALTNWYVWRDQLAARGAIERITSNVAEYADQAGSIPFVLRDLLTHGSMDDHGEPAAIRGRAVQLLISLSKASCEALRSLLEDNSQDQQSRSRSESSSRSLFSLTNVIASELYFAAGAFQQGRVSLPAVITRPEQTR